MKSSLTSSKSHLLVMKLEAVCEEGHEPLVKVEERHL